MRTQASILHLDLDAFFAAVEQRDKPSLRGKPVVVGGLSGRGVVSTASYEARRFGVHSAMPMHEARRLCPHAAFLSGRFGAYRLASRAVMSVLHQLSPLVEPMSLDEAYVDLVAGGWTDFSLAGLADLAQAVRAEVAEQSGGLTASVGLGSSKFIAKLASEEAKPDGWLVVEPGTERDRIGPLPVRSLPGVGPATAERLQHLGLRTVADLRAARPGELRRELGPGVATMLEHLALAEDDRPVTADRAVKSISVEDTFLVDQTDVGALEPLVRYDAAVVGRRLRRAGHFARTITVKLKLADFSGHTRSRSLIGAVDADETIAQVAVELLRGQAGLVRQGVRLVGVGVSGFTDVAQEALFEVVAAGRDESYVDTVRPAVWDQPTYRPGDDVTHATWGPGWVWGSGRDKVTVRFETATTGPGPVRTFDLADEALQPTPVRLPDDDRDTDSTVITGPGWAEGDEDSMV
ncbi:MAG: DNA polymerase IV [Propionibacteriaceae bacterium]|jgi:DNA polymerase-4|nr:DNA polymerase IV [Propionibacteriaceae bacterium]